MKTTIFYFCNGCSDSWWHRGMAMDEHGVALAEHICSNHSFLHEDLVDRRRKEYDARYPDGWEPVFVEDPRTHAGLQAAYAKNQERGKEEA